MNTQAFTVPAPPEEIVSETLADKGIALAPERITGFTDLNQIILEASR